MSTGTEKVKRRRKIKSGSRDARAPREALTPSLCHLWPGGVSRRVGNVALGTFSFLVGRSCFCHAHRFRCSCCSVQAEQMEEQERGSHVRSSTSCKLTAAQPGPPRPCQDYRDSANNHDSAKSHRLCFDTHGQNLYIMPHVL